MLDKLGSMPDTWILRVAVAAGAVAMAAAVVTAFGPVRAPQPGQPVTRAEAEALLDQAVRLAQAGDFTNLCESVASASGICRGLQARQSMRPWQDTPAVRGLDAKLLSYGLVPSSTT